MPSILYFIALWIITTTFFNNFYNFKDRLQQKYVGNSTTTILAKNYLNFKSVEFTWNKITPPEAFSWVWERIYIKISDTGLNTSNLNDYTTLQNIRKDLSGSCLKYLSKNESLFYVCKLQK